MKFGYIVDSFQVCCNLIGYVSYTQLILFYFFTHCINDYRRAAGEENGVGGWGGERQAGVSM